MLPMRRAKLYADLCKYREGVSKMNDMAVKLRRLQEEVAAMQPRLVERQSEATRIMALLQQEKMDAEATLQAILPEERQADAAAARKAELVKECEDELHNVMPPLRKALKGLLAIEKTSIAELKVMRNPPSGVKLVMRCICILLGRIPDIVQDGKVKEGDDEAVTAWWAESIRCLSDFHFLDKLINFDKDNVTPEMADQIASFVAHRSFDPEVVTRTSQSAAALCRWVCAMDLYQKAKKMVDPKREMLRVAEQELAMQEERLREARERLTSIYDAIAALEVRWTEANASRDSLQADFNTTQRKVDQAQRVLTAVKQEVERWQQSMEAMEVKHRQVLGEVLLNSGYIAYLGALPGSYRKQVEAMWIVTLERHAIPFPTDFSLQESLGELDRLEHWRDAR